MKIKVIRENGIWYVVSDIYKPPSAASVGSGQKWAEMHGTRQQARDEMKAIKLREGWK